MSIEITTMSLELPANRVANKSASCEMKTSVRISDDIIDAAQKLASEKIHEKYPNVIIAPDSRIHFSRRNGEDYFTASVEACIGDGDYVSRVVRIELPEFTWSTS